MTKKGFDVAEYLGDWYEQGSTPLWFSKGCADTKANYTLDENGNVNVKNICFVNGKKKVADGKAYKTSEERRLRVGFFPSSYPIFRSDYVVRYVDGKYQSAIVQSGKSVWILTRKKSITEQKYKEMLEKAEELGLDVSEVMRTSQTRNRKDG